MKIIFLDFDGPMLPLRAYHLPRVAEVSSKSFDPVAVSIIIELVNTSGAKIVISSNWAQRGRDYIENAMRSNGIPLDALHEDWTTPRDEDSGSWSRGKEVLAWVDAHQDVTHWVAFDDEEIEHPNAVLVSLEDGILSEHFERAKRLLGCDELAVVLQ